MVDSKTVEYIAHLSRLELKPQDIPHFVKELNEVLTYVEQLNMVDTSAVSLVQKSDSAPTVLRDDHPQQSLPPNELLKNGPSVKRGFFAIPKVIR
ncbi:MAG: Asp-tRNA(Asn)/Glu-tRNA(Gln) amidotransferase subunit GatC [Chitinivibrionales bacterium]|nr:Asp-tRNA(Asn)/Glu-tRNA(Gln) amidotransferase subunit GatC [Chitinivibrionales bacterium]